MSLDFEVDRGLVRKAARYDEGAMRQIVERHRDHVYRLAYRLVGDVDVAQDVTQETFLRALQNMRSLKNRRALRSWLIRIATHLVHDGWRTQREMIPLDACDAELPHAGRSPEHGVETREAREAREQIQDALMAIPYLYREAFLLKHVEDMAYRDIGEMLGIGLSAAKVRVHRACKLLRGQLAEQDSKGGE